MENGNFTYLVFIGVFLFGLYILINFVPFGLWVTAKISGVRLSLLDLIYMKIRRVAPAPIVRSMIMATKAGIEIQVEALEAHSMAGGNVENVVTGMIIAKNRNVQLSFKEACQMDLARKDLIKEFS
jgi:uncharacterized protein YqfA (UPF0365 family)